MANRFDTPYGQRYVSTYVPLPLEELSNLAQSYSNRYRTGQALPQQIDMLGQAIQAAPVDIDNKKQLIDDYKKAINDITSTAKPDDYAKPEYQNKINSLVYQFKNDPRLNTIRSNKEAFDKVYQPYLSSKDAKKDLVLTNIMSNEHSSGYKQLKPGEALAPLDYITHEDAVKGAKTIMDDIKIDGTPLSSISTWKRDGNYFIDQDGHRKEITKDKVMNLAKANVGNYAENSEGRFRFKTILNQVGLDPHMTYTEFKYDDNIPKDVKAAVDAELANDLYNYGSKQIFKDTDISYDLKADQLKLHAAKKKIDETVEIGMGQPVPGRVLTDVVPDNVKEFMTKDGKIDFTKMGKDIPKYGPNGILMDLKPGDLAGDAKKVHDFVRDAANAIGYKGEFKADNYNEILDAYNKQLSKIAPDYAMTPVETQVVSNSIKTQRNNYEFLDANGEKLTDNIALDKTFNADQKIIRKIGDQNVVMYKGSYVPEGETKPVQITVRPLGVQTNIANDRVANQQNRAIQFMSKGTTDKEMDSVQQAAIKSGLISKGTKVVDFQPDIVQNGIGYITLGNEKDRTNQGIIKVVYATDADGSLKILYQDNKITSPTEFMNEQFKAYYSTPQGIAELQPIMSNKQKLSTTSDQFEE